MSVVSADITISITITLYYECLEIQLIMRSELNVSSTAHLKLPPHRGTEILTFIIAGPTGFRRRPVVISLKLSKTDPQLL